MEKSVTVQATLQTEKKRLSVMLVWASFLVYVLMMSSKNAYTAEIIAIQDVFNKTKAEASLAMTYYFITYAIMQLVLSVIMGRINLKIYITVTAGISSILTVLIAFMPTIEGIYWLCASNGVLQAGIYSGCMAVISKYLPRNLLPFANRMMSLGTAVSGALSYGVPAIFVAMGMWNLPFIVLGVLFFFSVLFLFYSINKIRKLPVDIAERKKEFSQSETEKPTFDVRRRRDIILFFSIMMFITLISTIVHYAVLNWVPNLLHDVFGMPKEFSILITLLAPLAMLIGPMVIIGLCEKYRNIMAISLYFAVISLIFLIPLALFYDVNIVLTVILVVAFISISSGARAVFGSVLAFKMRSRVNSGGYLAATNSLAAVSAGVVPPIAGNVIDAGEGIAGYGTLYLYATIIFVLFIVCLLALTIFIQVKNKKSSGENLDD